MRRLLALVSQLPPESALARSRGPVWTNQDEALAFIAEMSADMARSARDAVQVSMSKGKYRPKFPVSWPLRPGAGEKPKRQSMTRDEMISLFRSRR